MNFSIYFNYKYKQRTTAVLVVPEIFVIVTWLGSPRKLTLRWRVGCKKFTGVYPWGQYL